MKKRFIKKIIVSTCFISFLVLLFSFINIFKCNNDISLVKSIIKNKYKSVNYDKKTKYLYAYKVVNTKYMIIMVINYILFLMILI